MLCTDDELFDELEGLLRQARTRSIYNITEKSRLLSSESEVARLNKKLEIVRESLHAALAHADQKDLIGVIRILNTLKEII